MVRKDKAMEFVLKHEAEEGRNPRDVSTKGLGYDIESDSRWIEVKGSSSKKPPFIRLSWYNFEALQKATKKGKEFWLYIVVDVDKKPRLVKLDKRKIFDRMKFGYYWEIPIRKNDLAEEFSLT
jgi:hypothetical protein